MEPFELLNKARDAMTVQKVFGEPYDRDGVTVVPVAKISGGGGGGSGAQGEGSGSGAGFGLSATPAGMYVLKDDKVSWQPAVDVNRVVLGGQLVALVALLVLRSLVRARARRG
ncbi:MAG: spore germination protein GerW family protein [Frankiaceae bacterium]